MEFLRLFLRHHLVEKPLVTLPNVDCFLRLTNDLNISTTAMIFAVTKKMRKNRLKNKSNYVMKYYER